MALDRPLQLSMFSNMLHPKAAFVKKKTTDCLLKLAAETFMIRKKAFYQQVRHEHFGYTKYNHSVMSNKGQTHAIWANGRH